MPPLKQHPPITGPLETSEALRAGGRDFPAGHRFPWKRLGMDEYRVKQMVMVRKLRPATKDLDVPDDKVELPPLVGEAQPSGLFAKAEAAAKTVRAKLGRAQETRSGA